MLPLPHKLVEELARRVLTDEAAKWFARLVWSTRLVVVGVVVEGIAVVHEVVEVGKQWFRRRKERADLKAIIELFPVSNTIIGIEPESHTPTWVKLFAFLGLVAVAVGVAGEWRYEVKFEAVTDEIQTFDSNRVTEAEKQAGNAAISAKDASDAADRANNRADAADIAAGKAQTKADVVGKQADQLLRKYTEAEAKIGEEQQKRMKLAAGLLPREVCNQMSLIKVISNFPPRKVLFEFVSETEPKRIAQRIAWAFANAPVRRGLNPPSWSFWRHRQVYEDVIEDGIHLMPGWLPAPPKISTAEYEMRRANVQALASAIGTELTKCVPMKAVAKEDEFAEMGRPYDDEISVDTLLIRIGDNETGILESLIKELGPRPTVPFPPEGFAVKNRVDIPDEPIGR